MDILLYTTKGNRAGTYLKHVIESLVFEGKTEAYDSIEAFGIRLGQTLYEEAIAVLLAGNREELLKILSIGDLLNDIPIILIIPDQDEDTIHKAHALRPRFLTQTNSDFKDVAAVLKKVIANKHSKQFIERRNKTYGGTNQSHGSGS